MQIVEIGDYSMTVMKDSQDAWWWSLGSIYRYAKERDAHIGVHELKSKEAKMYMSKEAIYTAGRMILFFEDSIKDAFQLHDKVDLSVCS